MTRATASERFCSVASVACLVALSVTGGTAGAVAAEKCLAAPNAATPTGQHWYYRLDRATSRKCWYLDKAGKLVRQGAPSSEPEPGPPAATTGRGAAAPEPATLAPPPQASAPQVSAVEVAVPTKIERLRELVTEAQREIQAPRFLPATDGRSDMRPDVVETPTTQDRAESEVDMREPPPQYEPRQVDPVQRAPSGPAEGSMATPLQIFAVIAIALAIIGLLMHVIGRMLFARRQAVDPGGIDWYAVRNPDLRRPVDLRAEVRLPRQVTRPPEDHDEITQLWQILRNLERRPQ